MTSRIVIRKFLIKIGVLLFVVFGRVNNLECSGVWYIFLFIKGRTCDIFLSDTLTSFNLAESNLHFSQVNDPCDIFLRKKKNLRKSLNFLSIEISISIDYIPLMRLVELLVLLVLEGYSFRVSKLLIDDSVISGRNEGLWSARKQQRKQMSDETWREMGESERMEQWSNEDMKARTKDLLIERQQRKFLRLY